MAYEFYITIEGVKQGKFKGESTKEKWKDKTAGIGFSYEVKAPTDTVSGRATGKRQHLPIQIIKQWGASSPQIFQALITHEILKTVLFEFVKSNANGKEEVYHIIRLTNAMVINYHPYINGIAAPGKNDVTDLEAVSFVFQKIEIKNKSGTMATDDWANAANV
jgi:type VI secretion system secreted protein Hcp